MSQVKTVAFNLSAVGGIMKREIVGEECHDLNFIAEKYFDCYVENHVLCIFINIIVFIEHSILRQILNIIKSLGKSNCH